MDLESFVDFISVFGVALFVAVICMLLIGLPIYFLVKPGSTDKFFKLLQKCFMYIVEAEKLFVAENSSSTKLNYVLDKIDSECKQLKIKYDSVLWNSIIENILACPQKTENSGKGEITDIILRDNLEIDLNKSIKNLFKK